MLSTRSRIIALLLCAVLLLCAFCGCADRQAGGDTTEKKDRNDSVQAGKSDNGKKKIAFTFDDGPQAPPENLDEGYYPYTEYILNKLSELKMRATFFVVGTRAKSYPGALRRAASLGCEIGSHTYEHTSFRGADGETIKSVLGSTSDAIAAAGVPRPKLFRPVGGSINDSQLAVLASAGYTTVGWSIDTLDYENRPKTGDKFSSDSARNEKYESFVNSKVELILSMAQDGAIILMHDIYMSSSDIFIRAADRLVAQGYELVTVSELLELNDKAPQPVMYVSKFNSITYMP